MARSWPFLVLLIAGCGVKDRVAVNPPVFAIAFSKEVSQSSPHAVLSEDRQVLVASSWGDGLFCIDLSGEFGSFSRYNLGDYNPDEIAISPNGRFVVGTKNVGSDPGRVLLLDLYRDDDTMSGLRALAFTRDDSYGPCFSQDGKWVLLKSPYESSGYTDAYSIPGLEHRILSPAAQPVRLTDPMLSPNGKIHLETKDRENWRVGIGKATHRVAGTGNRRVCFLTNRILCAWTNGQVTLYDSSNGNELCRMQLGTETTSEIIVTSPAGQRLPISTVKTLLAP